MFHFLELILGITIFCLLICYFYFKPFSAFIKKFTKDTFHSIYKIFVEVFNSEQKYFLIIPIASSIYFAIQLPVSYDEAFTYLNFTSQGIPTSMTYYPIPGNHILHSIFTNITRYLFFLNPLIRLRISSIFANFFICIFSYSFLKRYFNKNTAIIVVSIASMMFYSVYYSYMSRGYVLETLFFITAFYASYNIIKGNNQVRQWIYFGISSILGFYAMTSFLYPFILLNIFILIFNRENILKQTIVNVVVAVVVIILYIPIIKFNGIEAIVLHKTVAPIPRGEVLKRLPSFLLDSITDITGYSWVYTIPLMALSFILILIKKNKEYIIIFLLFIVGPVILLILHSVIPFSRTFNYYGYILIFVIAIPWSDLLQKINIRYLFIFLLLIQSILFCNFCNSASRNNNNFSFSAIEYASSTDR